jgi:exoribonuclease-2
MVVEIHFDADGSLHGSEIYEAWVHNRAKLAYNSVGAWLEGGGAAPPEIAAVRGLAENLRHQDRLAQLLRARRVQQGALGLETVETHAVFEGPELKGLRVEKRNRAKDLIEDFMIAANGATARYLAGKGSPSLRRVVRTPRRWGRIVELAAERGTALPATPDARALERFLETSKAADPVRFPDLSLLIVKLMGSGEYVLELPGQTTAGHFGLALKDYTYSTAPNRRFPDLITQRLLKAAGAGRPPPYRNEELAALALHCTETEDAVKKLERQVAKCAAALLLESRIGEEFDAIITAVAKGGTWLRLFHPPTEGKLVEGYQGKDAGQRIRVRLVATDGERGHIDLAAVE